MSANHISPRQSKEKSLVDHVAAAITRVPLFHPLRVVSSLIQFGYEPLPPTHHYSILAGRYLYYYPGFIGYARSIITQRGWKALYRGVGPAVIEDIASSLVSDFVRPQVWSIVNKLPLNEVSGDVETPDNINNITTTRATLVRGIKGFVILSFSGCIVEVIIRPFHVITLRTIAQHVGEETIYSGFLNAVKEIYRSEGISGFYAGLVPALVHQVVGALIYESIVIAVEEIIKLMPVAILGGGLAILKGPFGSYISRSYTYPFFLISNLLVINNQPMKAASLNPPFTSWRDSWTYLRESGNLFRGNAVLLPRFAHRDPRNRL